MSKWKRIWIMADTPEGLIPDGLYRVHMRGYTKPLFLGFVLFRDLKRIRGEWGINLWVRQWGRFFQVVRQGWGIILDYNVPWNTKAVCRIRDEVRWSENMGCYIGRFTYELWGKYRHIAWFTLTYEKF